MGTAAGPSAWRYGQIVRERTDAAEAPQDAYLIVIELIEAGSEGVLVVQANCCHRLCLRRPSPGYLAVLFLATAAGMTQIAVAKSISSQRIPATLLRRAPVNKSILKRSAQGCSSASTAANSAGSSFDCSMRARAVS